MRIELSEIAICLLSVCLLQGASTSDVTRVEPKCSAGKDQAETPESLCDLGIAVMFGTGGHTKNPDEGVRLIEQAARRGYAPAQYFLGLHYLKSNNSSEALKYLRNASNQGHAEALCMMGNAYLEGTGVSKDLDMAVEYFRRGAESGSTEAQRHLARCYEVGIGVSVDLKQARRWMQRAANSGDVLAKACLGEMLIQGVGGPANRDKGERLMLESASAGLSEALCDLAEFYLNGKFFEKNADKAVQLLRAGIARDCADAMAQLGTLLLEGRVIGQDYAQAKELFLRAIKQDNSLAYNNLGVMYEKGYGCEKDSATASRYYKKAHELGYPLGSYNLVCMHLRGESDDISDKDVESVLLAAAEGTAGEPEIQQSIQYTLGLLYEQGYKGVVITDLDKAKHWMTLAADNGSELAAEHLASMIGVELERAGEGIYALSSARQRYEANPSLRNHDSCFSICLSVAKKLETEIANIEKNGIAKASRERVKRIEKVLALFNALRDSLVPLEKGLGKAVVNGDLPLEEERPRREALEELVEALKLLRTEFVSEWLLAPDLAKAKECITLGRKPWHSRNDRTPIKEGMFYLTKSCDKDFLLQANEQIQKEFGEILSLLKDSVQPEEFEDYKTLSTLWGRTLDHTGTSNRGGDVWWRSK